VFRANVVCARITVFISIAGLAIQITTMTDTIYGDVPLDARIRSRLIGNNNGLNMHILEAGHEQNDRPCLLLLHGFPELAYSWRKVMPDLASAGYHVIAPDQRGFGCTTGWQADYDGDIRPFGLLNLVRDAVGLISALGYRTVHGVVGHDAGSLVAGTAALIRPDLFRSVVMMSAPYPGPPRLPFGTAASEQKPTISTPDMNADLAALEPPRKHYHWYYSTRQANNDMLQCQQGVHDFMRAYYHHKSADWKQNKPFALQSWTASELEKMPTYYIMRLEQTMPETVAEEMPSAEQIAACQWLTDDELRVYSDQYTRTGFQGGLQWYRCGTSGLNETDLKLFSGRSIDMPSCFIAGGSDWGTHQKPGYLETMRDTLCTAMQGIHLVDGAGHWVQQEQAQQVSRLLLSFLDQLPATARAY
jgi:pimeloyl-ACP methyl ester carboxylesterase